MKFILPIIFSLLLLTQHVFSQSNPCIENLSNEERDQLENISEGKMIYNTSTGCLNYFIQNKWSVFCEEKKESNVKYDPATGQLNYFINEKWVAFTMVPEEKSSLDERKLATEENEKKQEDNPIETSSNSDLPKDCQTPPTRPYAGRDLVSFDVVTLEGNRPSHGIGFWEILSGEGGSFVDSTVPNAQFMGVQGNTYYLKWTIATSCDTLSDESMVRIRPRCDPEPSQSYAGDDQFNVTETRLSANIPRSGKGSWTIVSGIGGNLGDHMDPKSTFTGKSGETYVLRWMIRNECGLTQDDVIISIKPPCRPVPSRAYAGENQIDIDKCRLKADLPEHGNGKWKVLEGEGGSFFNKESPTTTFDGKPGKTYVLQWRVSTECGSNADEVVIRFSSYCPQEMTDFRDGKKYKSSRYAGMCWMTENLDYRGDEIEWYCYDGYQDQCEKFGALYTWSAAMQGKSEESSQGICPEGWHLPSDKEWQLLIDSSGYNGAELQIGGESGFNVMMSGSRYTNGKFLNRREYAYYWTSSSKNEQTAWNRYFPYRSESAEHYPTDKKHSFSIRCVKDD